MDISAEVALNAIIDRVQERDRNLASLLQAAVDEGKSVERTEALKGRKNQTHTYRQVTKLSGEEALERVTSVLQAYFIELPMCIASMQAELDQAEVKRQPGPRTEGPGMPLFSSSEELSETVEREQKRVQVRASIDLANEAKLARSDEDELFALPDLGDDALASQRKNMDQLRGLLQGAN